MNVSEPGTDLLARLRARPRQPGAASFFYYDAHFRQPAVKVLPGEHHVDDEDILVMTTLGSCIAACLWDRERRVGGMNHFMLPDGSAADGGRYGAYAMALLIEQMLQRGADRRSMEAKVFGGGAVVSGMSSSQVGERNTRFVLDYLRAERITVVSKDVLDVHPRKVCFLPASGKVLIKRLASVHAETPPAPDAAAAARPAMPAHDAGFTDPIEE